MRFFRWLPFTLALVWMTSSSVYAARPASLTTNNFVELSGPKASFSVVYPGPRISGICGFEIRLNHFLGTKRLQTFANSIEVLDTTARNAKRLLKPELVWVKGANGRNSVQLRYKLNSWGTYMTGVILKGKKNKSFEQVLQAVAYHTKQKIRAIALARGCSSWSKNPTMKKTAAPVKSGSTSAMRVAKLFWQSMMKKDRKTLQGILGFPFAWDSTCNLYSSFPKFFHRVRTGPSSTKLRFVHFREATSKSPGLSPRFRRYVQGYEGLGAFSCGKKHHAEMARLLKYPQRLVVLVIKTPREDVPTVTRLSKIGGSWKVTGFDN
ncbi:MAG: hypothetical protein EP343_02330 [Deltaproteobacteria bacterium]|nr:MAG: hypothetical protein EP343_02330 [Deltaproteobacteria bacterium]